jgi:hypothetical protein
MEKNLLYESFQCYGIAKKIISKDKNGPQQWHRGKHKSQCIDLERH